MSFSISIKILLLIFLLSSCASSYHSIAPKRVNYINEGFYDSILFSYKYNVLKIKGNKKYTRKEDKKDTRLVAVRIENKSSQDINFKDLQMYGGYNKVMLLNERFLHRKLKQKVWNYLLYTPIFVVKSETKCVGLHCTTKYLSVFPLGIFIAIGNMVYATIANTQFKLDLNQNNLSNKVIKSGEVVYGLVGFQCESEEPLYLRKRDIISE